MAWVWNPVKILDVHQSELNLCFCVSGSAWPEVVGMGICGIESEERHTLEYQWVFFLLLVMESISA